jgi:hypothetical protein
MRATTATTAIATTETVLTARITRAGSFRRDVLENLCCERYGSCSSERAGEAREDAEVGVKRDLLKPANPDRAESPLVLQSTEILFPRLRDPSRGRPSASSRGGSAGGVGRP